jgi:hypothetical protein
MTYPKGTLLIGTLRSNEGVIREVEFNNADGYLWRPPAGGEIFSTKDDEDRFLKEGWIIDDRGATP